MSPQRVLGPLRTHRTFVAVIAACCVVAIAAFAIASDRLQERTVRVDDAFVDQATLIYQTCVANETQDAVIVAQLEAAKQRARLTLPPGSAELLYQLEVLNEGIDALEPPNEPDCVPPEGTGP